MVARNTSLVISPAMPSGEATVLMVREEGGASTKLSLPSEQAVSSAPARSGKAAVASGVANLYMNSLLIRGVHPAPTLLKDEGYNRGR